MGEKARKRNIIITDDPATSTEPTAQQREALSRWWDRVKEPNHSKINTTTAIGKEVRKCQKKRK